MKIAVFEVEPREVETFAALRPGNELALLQEPLTSDNATDFASSEVISTFIYSKLDRQVLEKLAAAKLLATRSTGFDHIDVAFCRERGITVSNVPKYGENTVAEHVFALLLTISHRMLEAVERAKTGEFSPIGLQGFDLAGKTLGVIGTGAIGGHVIRIAKGFGMKVLAFDITPDQRLAATLRFDYAPFDKVLDIADIVTLHAPATPETHHLLSDREFASMKDGAVLINTARGILVDQRALIKALRSGKIAAAGLDVMADEPMIREEAQLICSAFCGAQDLRNLIADHVLLRMPNVVVTPHSGFNTREAVRRIVEVTIENIQAFGEGRRKNTVVPNK